MAGTQVPGLFGGDLVREGHHIRRRTTVSAGIAAALAAAVVPGHSALATTTGSSNQSVTATVVAGTLTITAPPALVTNLTPGTANTGIALGSLVYTNTLNSGSAWSVTATSNDWAFGGNHIAFTNMSFTAGTTFVGGVGAAGTPAAGGGGVLSGTDTTPGTTQSTPVTLATGTSTVQGGFTQSGSTIAVTVPGGTPTGAYTGTIVYTITG
jgi:hypothetical protein